MRLAAHFGQWLEVGYRGRKARQWQVAAGLIYGQVKKSYRRRKLMRVTPVIRLGTSAALKVARPRTGLLGAAEHCFYRAGESDHPTWGGSTCTPHLGHGPAGSTPLSPPGMVASLLSLCASPYIATSGLVQPRARGGKLLAQRNLHRTPAMAAGRTNRRWTAREVLCYPLPPVPHFTI